jgi:hypothetical protein
MLTTTRRVEGVERMTFEYTSVCVCGVVRDDKTTLFEINKSHSSSIL